MPLPVDYALERSLCSRLRFGDDFGLSVFKREVRRVLPEGIEHWSRSFGFDEQAIRFHGGKERDDGS